MYANISLRNHPHAENSLSCATFRSEAKLFFSNFRVDLISYPVQNDFQEQFGHMAHQTDGPKIFTCHCFCFLWQDHKN